MSEPNLSGTVPPDWDETYWTRREAEMFDARIEGPTQELASLEKQLAAKGEFLKAFEQANFAALEPHLAKMSGAADEVAIAAQGMENIARAQGEARAFRYLLRLPEMLKADCEDLQGQIAAKRKEIGETQADAGLSPGRGAR